jgi:MerR family Zn(II)-responsive transcriptional regulator of zntA
MYTVSTLAKEAQVPVFTVRHYTRIGLLTPKYRAENGYRMFGEEDVGLLRFINSAKDLGFTLKEISEIIGMADHGESPCPLVREIIEKRIDETEKRIARLQKLLGKMREAREAWATVKDSFPNGHSVCDLIETFGDQESA